MLFPGRRRLLRCRQARICYSGPSVPVGPNFECGASLGATGVGRAVARVDAYRLCLWKMKRPAHRNSLCDGLQMAEAQLKKLCASDGISVHLARYARSKSIKWSFQALLYLNWWSIQTSVAESLAHRLRSFGCLDPVHVVETEDCGRSDGTRTRDVRRDRQAFTFPSFGSNEDTNLFVNSDGCGFL